MRLQNATDLLVLGALWGAAFLLMRVAAPEFGPVPLIAVRVTIAAVMLGALLALRGGLSELSTRAGAMLVVGAVTTALPFCLLAYAALTLPAGLTSTINASVPLFGAIVGLVWLGDRPSPMRVAGLVVGFAGVLVLAWPRLSGRGEWQAVAAALSATVLYGIGAHATPRLLAGVGPLAIATGSQVASTVMLLPLAFLQWPATAPSRGAWVSAVVLGVGCTAIAYFLYFRLIARAGPTTAMAVTYLIPVFGVTWGAMFLGEQVAGTSVAGGLLVLSGVALTAGVATRRVR